VALRQELQDAQNTEKLLRDAKGEVERELAEVVARLKKSKDECLILKDEWNRNDEMLRVIIVEREELNAELEKAYAQVQELTDALVEAETAAANATVTVTVAPTVAPTATTAGVAANADRPAVDPEYVSQLETEVTSLSAEVEQLQATIASYEEELTAAQTEALQKHEQQMESAAQLQTAEEALVTERSAVTEIKQALKKAEAAFDAANKEVDELREELSAAQSGTTSNTTSEALEAEKEALLVEMNSLMEAKMDAEARLQAAEAVAVELREQLSEYDKTSAQEQEMIMRAAEAEMDALKEGVEAHVRKTEALSEELLMLKDREGNYQRKCLELEKEVEARGKEVQEVEAELLEVMAERDSAIAEGKEAAADAYAAVDKVQ
jgi:chromosome segregation ATPase